MASAAGFNAFATLAHQSDSDEEGPQHSLNASQHYTYEKSVGWSTKKTDPQRLPTAFFSAGNANELNPIRDVKSANAFFQGVVALETWAGLGTRHSRLAVSVREFKTQFDQASTFHSRGGSQSSSHTLIGIARTHISKLATILSQDPNFKEVSTRELYEIKENARNHRLTQSEVRSRMQQAPQGPTRPKQDPKPKGPKETGPSFDMTTEYQYLEGQGKQRRLAEKSLPKKLPPGLFSNPVGRESQMAMVYDERSARAFATAVGDFTHWPQLCQSRKALPSSIREFLTAFEEKSDALRELRRSKVEERIPAATDALITVAKDYRSRLPDLLKEDPSLKPFTPTRHWDPKKAGDKSSGTSAYGYTFGDNEEWPALGGVAHYSRVNFHPDRTR